MEILFRFLALLLITRIIVSFDCPSKYNTECECQLGYERQDNVMNCPGPLKNMFSINPVCPFKYFQISFIPRKYVQVQCYEFQNLSNFHYNIRSEVQNSEQFILKNCTLHENTNLGEIAKLTGAENSQWLCFEENDRTEFAISKNNFKRFPNMEKLSISRNYKLTNISDDLLEYLPNLTYINLVGNKLKTIPEKIFQNVTKLTVLRLENNLIESLEPKTFQNLSKLTFLSLFQNKIVELKPHMFDDLISLETLNLRGNNLTSLPEDIFEKLVNLNVVDLMKNSFETLPAYLFQNNFNLTKINLQRNLLKTVPKGLFSNLSNLKEISLAVNALESLLEDLFRGLSKLENLDIRENYLQTLPEKIFNGLDNLKKVNLQQNRLTTISSSLLTGLRSLEVFMADENQIESIHKDAFETLVNLQIIQLSHNKISNLEKVRDLFFGTISVFSRCTALKKLLLSHNEISEIYADWIRIPGSQFNFLDLSHNRIRSLGVDELDFKHTKDFRLNLSNNKIGRVNLLGLESRFNSEKRSKISVDISNNPIVCDCTIYEFLRYLDGSISRNVTNVLDIQTGNSECARPDEYKGTLLSSLNSRDFRCNAKDYHLTGQCPESCSAKVNFHEETLIIDCAHKNLTEAPRKLCNFNGYEIELNLRNNFLRDIPNLNQGGFDKVKRLLLSGNKITTIHKDAFSPRLETLELHSNAIMRLNPREIRTVINSSLKNISLSGNPWECNCETREFLDFVQNSAVISDANKITCKNSEKPLKAMTANELCLSDNMSQILCNIPKSDLNLVWDKTCRKPNVY